MDTALLKGFKYLGRHFWFTLHCIALWAPHEGPEFTDEQKRDYKDFFQNLHKVIPCGLCSHNYIEHLKSFPLDQDVMKNRETLFRWTVDIHNLVNKELNKEIWSQKKARDFYHAMDCPKCSIKKGWYKSEIESYIS